LIKGEGDRLTIKETGIDMLGSMRATPDRVCSYRLFAHTLRKGRTLILEMLTQFYPDALEAP
jgi:hypothetical protein